MTINRKVGRALFAVAFAAGLSTAAFAAAGSQISVSASDSDANHRIASVNTADLDLTRPADQRALHARLASAVQEACTFGSYRGPRASVDLGCAGDAKASAARQADAMIAGANSHQAVAVNSVSSVHGAN